VQTADALTAAICGLPVYLPSASTLATLK